MYLTLCWKVVLLLERLFSEELVGSRKKSEVVKGLHALQVNMVRGIQATGNIPSMSLLLPPIF